MGIGLNMDEVRMPDGTAAGPYTVRALDASTWDAFAELVERNGGVFGGCWCMGHHAMENGESYRGKRYDKRATKEALVRTGRAHAALVFDTAGRAQGWEYGRLEELRSSSTTGGPMTRSHRRCPIGASRVSTWTSGTAGRASPALRWKARWI